MLLDLIEKENDIKKIPEEDWPKLSEEIRQFLIEKISVRHKTALISFFIPVVPPEFYISNVR